jgi:probable phosphoglycerate mutase
MSTAEHAYGLTARGRDQVRVSVGRARDDGTLGTDCRIVSSPLLRTRESAEVAATVLGAPVDVDPRLIERDFGSFELTSDANYAQVWAEDVLDPSHGRWGVESVRSILRRITALIEEVEAEWRTDGGADPGQGPRILLCTHGDVASTLCCAAVGHPLGRHREVGALANAEIRALGPIGRPSPPEWAG